MGSAVQYKFIQLTSEGDHLHIKLNRPEKRNAINDEMLLEIEQAFTTVAPNIKCILIHAEGNHFSAGLDLSELTERDLGGGIIHSRMWHRVMDQIQFGKAPVVAVLKGACIGGGLELASACHIRVAEPSTFYALPEGQRGIYVGGGASLRLPKLIGVSRMTDMMITGRVITAVEGLKIGISQYLTSESEGLAKGIELAHKVASNTSMTNFALTQVLPRIAELPHDQALLMESLMVAIAQQAPEAKERLQQFLKGNAPKVNE
jgi:enoyl-CoA hydratase/carnithine racemase